MTNALYKIEFVCTANQGRSPVAELIARNHLQELDIKDLEAISSGSHARAIQAGENPLEVMLRFINLARERTGDSTIYSLNDERILQGVIARVSPYLKGEIGEVDENDLQTVKKYFHRAEEVFHREEMRNRARALRELGIEGEVKQKGEQTKAAKDRLVVLPMAQSNLEGIIKIYDTAGVPHPPEGIVLLGEYATGDPNASIPDAFGRGFNAYMDAIDTLQLYVPKAVERAVLARDDLQS